MGAIATSRSLSLMGKFTDSSGVELGLVESVLNHVLEEGLGAVALPVASHEVLSPC